MDILKYKKILVVDDDKTTRLTHKLLIEKLGATDIIEASSVEEAISLIGSQHTDSHPIGLILSDFVMPEETGLDLYKYLILTNNHIPFAMVTANSDKAAVKEMIELGINSILVKPITVEMLQTKIAKIL